jgi:multiple sugar transport system substrate-binding protein
MKKYFLMIIIIAMIILSLSVVSCAEKVSIRFSWWGSQVRNDITLKVIKMFEEKYPDINVVPEYTGYGGYWTKINIQAAGSNLPDVFQISTNHIKIYANNSEMLNLNPYVNNGTLKTNTINPKLLNSANFDGKLLALIQGASPLAILYH